MHTPRDRITAFLVLLPSVILLAIFVYGFIGQSFQFSLTDWGVSRDPDKAPLKEGVEKDYLGADNYEALMTLFSERQFRTSMVNTVFFTVFFLVGCLVFGFLLAFLIDQRVKGEAVFRTIFLFPMSLSFVVTGTIWNWLLQPNGGINILPERLTSWLPESLQLDALEYRWMNNQDSIWNFKWEEGPKYLTYVGLVIFGFAAFSYLMQRRWRTIGIVTGLAFGYWLLYQVGAWDLIWLDLEVPGFEEKGYNLALTGIIIAACWQMAGYVMALYLAGIRGIPEELREAARVDGCAEWQVYLFIILPGLRPITLSAMIILGHISLKIFDLVFAMSGPDNANTVVPGILLYTKMFRGNEFARGSAIAIIMLVMVSVVIIPYLWSSLRTEERV